MRPVESLRTLYHPDCPDFLRCLAETPAMARLGDVGMNCGCQYTAFPLFRTLPPYSRLDHSIGVALIVWHFTRDPAQAAAGLFHDIATPVFSHVVDFLLGDHLRQEATEERTGDCIRRSPEIMAQLTALGLTPEAVEDYHRYSVADNDSPRLSADRLEYTLGNLLNYGFADLPQLRRFYEDLTVCQGELTFCTRETAAEFALAALRCSRVYVADEDRFAMEALADLLRTALDRGCLTMEDLWGTEQPVIARLTADPVCGPLWTEFRGYSRIRRTDAKPSRGRWFRVDAKLRYIDPCVAGLGPISRLDSRVGEALEAFRQTTFDDWIGL